MKPYERRRTLTRQRETHARPQQEAAKTERTAAPRAQNERGTKKDDIEMTRGYAFSQEEGGAISQTEYIRRYDTTSASNRSKSHKSGGT